MTPDLALDEKVEQAAAVLWHRLRGRVLDLQVCPGEAGVVLRGRAVSYHVKQLAQHITMIGLGLPVLANEIEVSPAPESSNPAFSD